MNNRYPNTRNNRNSIDESISLLSKENNGVLKIDETNLDEAAYLANLNGYNNAPNNQIVTNSIDNTSPTTYDHPRSPFDIQQTHYYEDKTNYVDSEDKFTSIEKKLKIPNTEIFYLEKETTSNSSQKRETPFFLLPIQNLQRNAKLSPFSMKVVDSFRHDDTFEKLKLSVLVEITSRLRRTFASFRGKVIHYTAPEIVETNLNGHVKVESYKDQLADHIKASVEEGHRVQNFLDFLPYVKEEKGWLKPLAALYKLYQIISLSFEVLFKILGALLTQPLRNYQLNRLQHIKESSHDKSTKKGLKRLSEILFKTDTTSPPSNAISIKNGFKWAARGIYYGVTGVLYLLSLPLSLAGDIVADVHGIVDSLYTLTIVSLKLIVTGLKLLGAALNYWYKKTEDNAATLKTTLKESGDLLKESASILWVATKNFVKSALSLIPTAITLFLLFTPLVPVGIGFLIVGKVGATATVASLFTAAYSYVSLYLSEGFNNISSFIFRKIDKKEIEKQRHDFSMVNPGLNVDEDLNPTHHVKIKPSNQPLKNNGFPSQNIATGLSSEAKILTKMGEAKMGEAKIVGQNFAQESKSIETTDSNPSSKPGTPPLPVNSNHSSQSNTPVPQNNDYDNNNEEKLAANNAEKQPLLPSNQIKTKFDFFSQFSDSEFEPEEFKPKNKNQNPFNDLDNFDDFSDSDFEPKDVKPKRKDQNPDDDLDFSASKSVSFTP